MKVEVSSERLEEISTVVAEAMNKLQYSGYSIDEVLCGVLLMAGRALKQRGAVLHFDKPLREALPPVVMGYESSEEAELWQTEAMKGKCGGH